MSDTSASNVRTLATPLITPRSAGAISPGGRIPVATW
jgi:hypothetical protein